MSENLHHHDEQWDDMPLPNEEEAWQKMKRLLDKEDKRRRFLPFPFWRYGLLGLLLVGAATGGYFLLNQDRKQTSANALSKDRGRQQKEAGQTTGQNKLAKGKAQLQPAPGAQKKAVKTKAENKVSQVLVQENRVAATKKKEAAYNSIRVRKPGRNITEDSPGAEPAAGPVGQKPFSQEKRSTSPELSPQRDVPAKYAIAGKEKETALVAKKAQPDPAHRGLENKADSLKPLATSAGKDSATAIDSAKKIAAPPVVSNEPKKAKTANRIRVSYGIGLQQAIAFNGQQSASYDTTGKKIGWFNYIPSVYLRLEKEKWALLAEFHYRDPQLVNPFSYSQLTSYDAANALVRTEQLHVQKLYYRQLLLSINRVLLPHWSWGVGGTYNLLTGAVTEQQTEDKNVVTGDETFRRNPFALKGYRDSFLYKSTAGILLQTDYHWKRISVGLRYTMNLQPFIKYTRPDGAVLEKKNQVLQAVLRFSIKN